MKRVVMIIAPDGFRDEELFIPKKIMEESGVEVRIASTRKGMCRGMLGGTAEAELSLDEINVDEYDAIMFVGGRGTPLVRKEERALQIARDAAQKGKVVSAICWAPTTLAKAGVLKGKKATVWIGEDAEYGMRTDKVLEKFGAIYEPIGVVEDGNVITADGPASAEKYAKTVLNALES